MKNVNQTGVTKRLMPLYIAALLQGIPFWYAIEKLFMVSIGFNTASIGLMVAIMSGVMIIVETPSGILADRWSRKGVMILGCLSLLFAGISGALSYNQPVYILSTVFWGIYAALYSGTYDAVIYDIVVEETGDSKGFEKYLGRFRAVEGFAFVVGALTGGVIADRLNMRDTYIFSLPFLCLSFIFLWKFSEPKLHRAEVAVPVFRHIRQTFAAVLKNPVLLPVVVSVVCFSVLQDTLFEFSQLWFIAVAAPVAMYGVFSAAVFSSWTTGGLLASKIKTNLTTITLAFVTILSLLSLVVFRNYVLILLAQLILAVSLVSLSVILAKKLHDELPSRLRAGSSSVVSTMARTLIIPGSLVFTFIANKYSIFQATYIMFGLAIVATTGLCFAIVQKHKV